MNYTIAKVHWQTEQAALQHIRTSVFVHEQHVSQADEWDGKDDSAIHFLAKAESGAPIACARLLEEMHQNKSVFHIGRVAVLAAYRQQGLGRQLMRAIISECEQLSAQQRIYLHAQTTRQHFYEHLGFAISGEIFMEAGIPHIEMWYK